MQIENGLLIKNSPDLHDFEKSPLKAQRPGAPPPPLQIETCSRPTPFNMTNMTATMHAAGTVHRRCFCVFLTGYSP